LFCVDEEDAEFGLRSRGQYCAYDFGNVEDGTIVYLDRVVFVWCVSAHILAECGDKVDVVDVWVLGNLLRALAMYPGIEMCIFLLS
jgi:hypothetical protein